MTWFLVAVLGLWAVAATAWGWHQRTAANQLHDAVVAFLAATREPLTPEQVRSAVARLERTLGKILG